MSMNMNITNIYDLNNWNWMEMNILYFMMEISHLHIGYTLAAA